MSVHTMVKVPNETAEAQAAIESAITPRQRRELMTYVWECVHCGHSTVTGPGGGTLDECCPSAKARSGFPIDTDTKADYRVTTILGSTRRYLGLVSEMKDWEPDPLLVEAE